MYHYAAVVAPELARPLTGDLCRARRRNWSKSQAGAETRFASPSEGRTLPADGAAKPPRGRLALASRHIRNPWRAAARQPGMGRWDDPKHPGLFAGTRGGQLDFHFVSISRPL